MKTRREGVGESTEKVVHLVAHSNFYINSLSSPLKSPLISLYKSNKGKKIEIHFSGQCCVHGSRVFVSSSASDDNQNPVKLE